MTSAPNRREFYRFKYAEEFAQALDRQGYTDWKMYRDQDEGYEEDGEFYYRPRYTIEWNDQEDLEASK